MCKKRFVAFLFITMFSVWGSVTADAAKVPSSSESQQNRITVKGTVKDANNEPVIGAGVLIKGTTNGTVTDSDGNYSISVPGNAVLVISSVGYAPITVSVNNRAVIDITLNATAEELKGVVVTAMGIVRNTRTLSYATQSVKGEELAIARGTSGNLLDELKGKISGADINTSSHIGGSSRIVLRGVKSVYGSANALIIVDGVPVQNPNTDTYNSVSRGFMGSDGMIDINPDDIASVDVLKGPSAAALYGSEAANGAVIITTKKGSAGRYEVNVNSSTSIDSPVYLMRMQNSYGRGNGGKYVDGAGESWGAKADCVPDNFKEVFQNGYTFNNSVSLQSGNEKMQGFASYTNNHSIGNIKHNFMNKHTFDVRYTTSFTKRLSTDAKITYTQSRLNNMPLTGDQGIGMCTYNMPRDLTMAELGDYETINPETNQPIPVYWTLSSIFNNPKWIIERVRRNQYRDRILAMGSVKYDIFDWLNVQGRWSYDLYKNRITQTAYDGTNVWASGSKGGTFSDSNSKNTMENLDVLVSGENSFLRDFKITYNVGASVKKSKWNSDSQNAAGLLKPNKFHMSFARSLTTSWDYGQSELQSVYGTAQLSWREAVYFDITGRNDWASTLPSNYSYFYPSFGLTGILSELASLPEWISFAKVRGSWAKVGAAASPYMLKEVYSSDNTYGYTYPPTVQMLSDLKPQMTSSWEIGTEWKFLSDRLGIDFTYYSSRTKNQFINISVPWSSGYSSKYINCGRVDNKGLELTISAIPIQTGDFAWSTRFNFSHNKNELKELYEDLTQMKYGGSDAFISLWSEVGKEVGRMHGQTWQKDDNGNYVVDKEGLPQLSSATEDLGRVNPSANLGWSNTITYKRFRLNFLIDGKIGGFMMSGTDAVLAYYGVADYTKEHRDGNWVLDAVNEDGSKNTTPISSEAFWRKVSGGRFGAGGFFLFDATNIRLRQLSLTYDVPMKENNFIKGCSIALTGHNLFFFYRGKNKLSIPGLNARKIPIDPDQSVTGSAYQGVELGILPSVRSFGININLKF